MHYDIFPLPRGACFVYYCITTINIIAITTTIDIIAIIPLLYYCYHGGAFHDSGPHDYEMLLHVPRLHSIYIYIYIYIDMCVYVYIYI